MIDPRMVEETWRTMTIWYFVWYTFQCSYTAIESRSLLRGKRRNERSSCQAASVLSVPFYFRSDKHNIYQCSRSTDQSFSLDV